jgi:peptide/nickel transport system substrate-binding protein
VPASHWIARLCIAGDQTGSRQPRVSPCFAASLALALGSCSGGGAGTAASPRPALRVAVAPELDSLDPYGLMHGGQALLSNVFEGLVAFDAQMHVVPALALRWESPDELTWRFYLRPDVRFHDGRRLAAEDVVRSLARVRHPGASEGNYLSAVSAIASPAPDVVEIRTSRPDPMLLNNLVPSFVVAARPDGSLVGTGPYRVTRFDPQQGLEISAFPEHWREPPHEARIRFVFEREPERRLQLLRDGAVDVALRLPEAAQASAGFSLFARAAPGARLIGLRVDAPPFSDLRLRQAIDLALDRATITRELLGGRAQPLGQILPQGFFGHAPGLEPRNRDLAAARALVSAAMRGQESALVLAHGSGRKLEAERIAAQLAEAGLRIRLESRPAPEISAALASGAFPMILWSLISYTGDANDVLGNVLHSPDPSHGWGGQNSFGYRNQRLDQLVERAVVAGSMSLRLELFQGAMREAMKDLALVPLWEVPWVTGVRDDVAYQPGADGWFWGATARRLD